MLNQPIAILVTVLILLSPLSINYAAAGVIQLPPAKIGVFSDGYWYLDTNQSWAWDGTPTDTLGIFGLGIVGAIPVAGDWNSDGKTEIGVFIDGIWYLDMNGNGQWDGEGTDVRGVFGVGVPNAIPVIGDWTGDGKTKIGIYSDGIWYLDANQTWDWNGEGVDIRGEFGIGLPNPKPVTGDWNGDGITEIGVYSEGNWYLDKNKSWAWEGEPSDTYGAFGTGLPNVVPVTGDWNSDGITKIGVYSDGNWYLDTSNSWDWEGQPTDTYVAFGTGLPNVVPVVGNWYIAPDVTAPIMVSVSPGEWAYVTPVNSSIYVTFNEAINAASIAPGAIIVKDSGNNLISGTLITSGRTVIFTPSATLNASSTYFVTVAPGIRDLAGNATTTGYSWQFLTTLTPDSFNFSITPASSQFNAWRGELNSMVFDLAVTTSTPIPVTLSIEGCPPAAVCMASPNNVFNYIDTPQQYVTLLITTSALTPLRSYPVTLRGDGSGVQYSSTVTVNVGPPRSITQPTEVWGKGGIPVTTAPDHQLGTVATGDGAGGAIFLWEENYMTWLYQDIYGQRIGESGSPLWPTYGYPFITALNDLGEPALQSNITAIADGIGGAIFAWEDDRHLQGDIFAQRVNGAGITPWPKDGVPVCTACWITGPPCANTKSNPQMVPDGVGGVIITWHEARDGFHGSVWAQRITANGVPVWQTDGVPVAYGNFNADFARIVSDGAGGAIIIWQDGRDSVYKYRAQRLSALGAPLWTVNGLVIASPIAHRGLSGFSVIPDNAGGAIIAWTNYAPGDNSTDIFAQRINAAGNSLWQSGGVPVCLRSSQQFQLTMTTDAAGGAIIAWEDIGASPPGSGQSWIFAQRLNAEGTALWQVDGIPLYTFHGLNPQAISDDAGGAIFVWDGFHLAGPNQLNPAILAQHVAEDGTILWTPNGFEIFSLAGSNLMGTQIISDGLGGAILYWTDYRLTGGETWDIFAQRLTDKVP